MTSFAQGFIEQQPIPQGFLQTIRLIGEYKGKQELFKQQAPQVLETLRQVAIIQSTESSNRIEGITVPLERIVERTKESYYDTLYQSSQDWHEGQHRLLPWWEYFLGVMLLSAYREFEQRVGLVTSAKGTKTAMLLDAIANLPGEFSIRELQERCPIVSIDLIRRILRRERDAGHLECQGRGVDARWHKQ
ncbi:MAG TPA: hypothetical protein DDZ80_11455 [Cyanobacteria bacterium UBA8803]|nr:hypothetical protein [Cyanobacteria bacterium UBA8803]